MVLYILRNSEQVLWQSVDVDPDEIQQCVAASHQGLHCLQNENKKHLSDRHVIYLDYANYFYMFI